MSEYTGILGSQYTNVLKVILFATNVGLALVSVQFAENFILENLFEIEWQKTSRNLLQRTSRPTFKVIDEEKNGMVTIIL